MKIEAIIEIAIEEISKQQEATGREADPVLAHLKNELVKVAFMEKYLPDFVKSLPSNPNKSPEETGKLILDYVTANESEALKKMLEMYEDPGVNLSQIELSE